MKWQVRIVIVSVVVGFILEYNHYYNYYYYHPYPLLNNPNPKTEVCSQQISSNSTVELVIFKKEENWLVDLRSPVDFFVLFVVCHNCTQHIFVLCDRTTRSIHCVIVMLPRET